MRQFSLMCYGTSARIYIVYVHESAGGQDAVTQCITKLAESLDDIHSNFQPIKVHQLLLANGSEELEHARSAVKV